MQVQFTIIIITYNRYPFLLRLLKYFNSYDIPFKLLILDSSSDKLEDEELIKLLSQKNVIHKLFDSDIFFVNKIAKGCEFIDTEYAVICADDDFIIPGSIVECIEFLKNNPEFSSAQGINYSFNFTERSNSRFSLMLANQWDIYGKQNSGKERASYYLAKQPPYNPFYAVHKADVFSLIWSESTKYVDDWGLSELFPCALSLVYGKMEVLPCFYTAREASFHKAFDVDRIKKMYSEDKIKNFIEGIAYHINKVENLSINEAKFLIGNSFDEFIFHQSENWKRKQLASSKNNLLLYRIRQKVRLRSRIKILFKYFNKLIFSRTIKLQDIKDHPSSLSPKYFSDYEKVRQAVISAGCTYEQLIRSRKDID